MNRLIRISFGPFQLLDMKPGGSSPCSAASWSTSWLLLEPPLALTRYIQASVSAFTLPALIFVSGLKRRPEKSPL